MIAAHSRRVVVKEVCQEYIYGVFSLLQYTHSGGTDLRIWPGALGFPHQYFAASLRMDDLGFSVMGLAKLSDVLRRAR